MSENGPGYYCYIVECADGSLYTGWTTDPTRRVKEHNAGRGALYTRWRRPVELRYVEEVGDRSSAQQREFAIKALSREKKLVLVEAYLTNQTTSETL
ncbi:MAG: GIY-YIG nuclease family protein [Anaerolineales bacterium]|nr:MAG: GIY-YIG nuclease family protein [Anaerolineales bacterium]